MPEQDPRQHGNDAGEQLPEKKHYSEEEASRLILERKPFPKNADKLFGKKNLIALQNLLHDPTIQDLNMCDLCGYLDVAASVEYVQQLDEFHIFRVALTDLAYTIVDHVKPKITYYLDKTFDERGHIKVGNQTTGIFGLIDMAETTIYSQGLPGITMRNARLVELSTRIQQHIILECFKAIDSIFQGERRTTCRDTLIDLFAKIKIRGGERDGNLHPISIFIHSLDNLYHVSRENEKQQTRLSKELQKKVIPANEQDKLFNEINELSIYRTIPELTTMVGEAQIRILGEKKEKQESRVQILCTVEINFNPKKSSPDDRLLFTLDRGLRVFELWGTNLDIEKIINKKTTDGLMSVVLELLYNGLKDKDEDITPITLPPTEPEVLVVQPTEDEETFEEAALSEKIPVETQPPEETTSTQERRRKKKIIMPGLRGSEVARALTKMLGDPLRIGDHLIFRTPTGKTGAIPNHPAKDINPGLLLTCIKRLGISRENFIAALK